MCQIQESRVGQGGVISRKSTECTGTLARANVPTIIAYLDDQDYVTSDKVQLVVVASLVRVQGDVAIDDLSELDVWGRLRLGGGRRLQTGRWRLGANIRRRVGGHRGGKKHFTVGGSGEWFVAICSSKRRGFSLQWLCDPIEFGKVELAASVLGGFLWLQLDIRVDNGVGKKCSSVLLLGFWRKCIITICIVIITDCRGTWGQAAQRVIKTLLNLTTSQHMVHDVWVLLFNFIKKVICSSKLFDATKIEGATKVHTA